MRASASPFVWSQPPLCDAAALAACTTPSTLDLVSAAPKSLTGAALWWGCGDSPFGPAVVAWRDDRLCGLGLPTASVDPALATQRVLRGIADPKLRQDDRAAAALLAEAAAGRPPGLLLLGTPWRLAVWRMLTTIPCGRVASYAAMAELVGRPKGARAVGGAVGANPISWLIPCHRVIAADGGLGGFGWGLPKKQQMLRVEGALAA